MNRKAILFFLFFFCSFFTFAQTWEAVGMHGGGYVTGIYPHPTDENIVFARIDVGGIYKCTNKGDQWTNITKDIPLSSQRHFQVRSFVIDSTNTNNLYFIAGNSAYSDESSFWWSDDGGTNWNQGTIPTQTNGNHFGRSAGDLLVLDPNDANTIYLAGLPHYDNGRGKVQADCSKVKIKGLLGQN